jgi:hypothetical protein
MGSYIDTQLHRTTQIEHEDVLRVRVGEQCREIRRALLLHTPHTPGKRLEFLVQH